MKKNITSAIAVSLALSVSSFSTCASIAGNVFDTIGGKIASKAVDGISDDSNTITQSQAPNNFIALSLAKASLENAMIQGARFSFSTFNQDDYFSPEFSFGIMNGSERTSLYDSTPKQYNMTLYTASLGLNYRPKFAQWFRIHPEIGYSILLSDHKEKENGEDLYISHEKTYFTYGVGIQFNIPYTPAFVDVNYSKLKTDFNNNLFSIGFGYSF